MRKITFITGNAGKLREAQSIIPEIVGKEIDLPEIQEIDARKVIEAKLLEAYRHHKDEYVVEDVSLCLECLGGLPGPLIKWFLQALGDKGLAEMTLKLGNPAVVAKAIVGYIDEKGNTEFFEGSIKGKIVSPKGDKGFGFDKIFLPDGCQKTFGEMSEEEKNQISMRKIAFKKLADYLQKTSL